MQSRVRITRVGELLRKIPPISQYHVISTLADAERFELLADFARWAYLNAENAASYDNLQKFATSDRDRAKRYAEDLLDLAAKLRKHPNYGTAIYKGNMTLGSLALQEGDRRAAVRYMLTAARAPASEELMYSHGVAAWDLLPGLLREGERESVIRFLEAIARTNVVRRAYLIQAATEIRRGQMPLFDRMGYVEKPPK
jgi:hypothetical protein